MNDSRIKELRQTIDEIDAEMVRLFVKRMGCAVAIGLEKNADQVPLFDENRESEILKKVVAALPSSEYEAEVIQLYESLLKISKSAQAKHL